MIQDRWDVWGIALWIASAAAFFVWKTVDYWLWRLADVREDS